MARRGRAAGPESNEMWLSRNQRIQGYRLRVRHELTKSAALRRSEDLGLMVAKKGRVSGLGRPRVRESNCELGRLEVDRLLHGIQCCRNRRDIEKDSGSGAVGIAIWMFCISTGKHLRKAVVTRYPP